MTEGTLIAMGGIVVTLIGWFLNEIYKTFKETKNDVKQLLLNGARRDQQLDDLVEKIDSLEADIMIWSGKIDTNAKDIKQLQIQVSKNQ